ncbi:DNA polymerase theta (helicase domain only), putative [Leishmania donovani]|uniref:DNA polymerase theta (Helicase domain only), putative n=1 Tax=Leishmania donovani TaxID=5661 RepID=E9BGH8_LEIDO|nr:DNA polymerase theta (helicase domain only), putative [Leishmania donovani]CBZ34354.1 DNA polymerase theta (helicase domain only), putative [Leishmania donovani]
MLSRMRRTMTTTKGFRAPRPRGSHEQPAETTVSSTNSAAPPPPPSASSARKVSARGSTLAVPSPSPSSSSAYCRKSPSRCKKASTIAAATGDAGAGTTAFDPKSGGLSFPQGPRGVLSGHFSANHLRRAPRQTDQATPRDGASNTATAMRAPADTTTVATAAAQHTAARASGDDRVVALSSSNTPLLRKRPRSLSPDDPYAGGAHHRDEPASTRGCAPSASRDSNRVKSDDTTLVQLSIPRLPTARRLSTSRIRRTVFYPPSAEQPLALLRSSHDADGAGAMGAPESAPVPRVSSAPAPADVCVAADYTVHVHPWGSATAVPAWTGASDAVPVAPGADALRVPGANSAVCVGREPHSSTAVSEHHKTPLAAAMTASTILSPSTRSGKRFLSAMEHEQRDYAAAISPAPPSLTSSSLLPPYRSPCHSGASEQVSPAPPAAPSTPKAAPSTPPSLPLPLPPCDSTSPSPAVPQLRVHDLAALSLPSLSREASLLPSNSRRGLSVPLSSPRLERAESPLSPLLADSSPAPAIGLTRGQAGALVAAAAAGGERQTLSSLASPARSVGELARVQQQQPSTHPSSALAAAEEAEREECDEALECEMAEDLRMSTDIAFTPSGTGSCAPPLFSQSSMMQEEERQAEEEGGGEGATYIMRDSAVAVERADDDSELRSGPGMSGHEGSAQPLFRFQDGAGDVLISGSTPPPSIAIPAALNEHAFLSGCSHGGGTATTYSSTTPPASSLAVLSSAFARLPSAPSTWPIRAATPPHLPSVLAPGTELLPLGVVTAAVAADGGGGLSVGRMGPGRHRTVFSFSSLRVGNATAAALPDPFPEPQLRLCQPSVTTTTDQACAGSARNVAASVAEPATPVSSPPSEACATTYPPDLWLPSLPAEHVSPPRDPLLMRVPSQDGKAEGCAAHGVSQMGVVAPTPMSPGSDALSSATGVSALSAANAAPPLSDLYVTALPYLAEAAAGGSGAPAVPARPGRTCFTLHSAARTTGTLSSSAAATSTVEPTAAAAAASTGAVPPTLREVSYLSAEKCSFGGGTSELQQLPGHGAVPPQGTEGPTASLDGVRSATPRATRKVPSSMESRHTTGCAQQVIANAQPALLRPVDSTPATVVMHRTPSTLTSEEPAWSRRSAPFPQPWPLLNDGYPPALLTVAPVTPLVGCMGAETPTVAAPQSAQAPVAHDEAAQPYPRESREMVSYAPLAPPQPPSPPLPRPACTDDTWELFYDLPREVGHFYATRRGVTSLYDWQHDVLTRPEVRQGGNFVYSLPTSGGKTLVAELSLLRCVLNRRKSCFLVLPFVSLAEEKTMALQPLTTAYDFNVDGHYGSSGRFPLCGAPAVYVCTIEKANSLLNHMLEEGRADEIGAVVVDELHMVGESGRGATLELFLSKVLVINAARQRKRDAVVAPATQSRCSASGSRPGWPEELEDAEEDLRERTAMTDTTKAAADPGPLQIIGMSATVSNLRTLAEWLRAACFEYDFRPVPLHAYSVVGGLVLRDGQRNERNLSGGSVTQHLVELVTEVPDASVLIFCASRQQCVDTAKGIVNCLRAQAIAGQKAPSAWVSGSSDAAAEAQHVSVLGVPFPSLTRGPATAAAMAAVPSQASAAIKGLLADLEALAHHEASQLSEVIAFGVAFHHGGLLAEERDLIETAFRRKHIRILCCTSTLAAGVNLPARRVIIKTPYVGREFLTKSRYLQMCGRAGRAGLDTYGESFLLLSSRDQARGHALMHAAVEPCCSKLLEDDQTLTRSLLECVGVGLVADFQSACQWSGSLLSRWAVGPVDVSWQPHIPAAAAPAASASTGVAPPGAAAKGTCESVTGLFLASEVGYDGDAAAAQDSESSRSAPGPPASPPSHPASPTSPSLTCVPPAAMNAMVRASLVTLARCGFIRVACTRAGSGGSNGAGGRAAAGAAVCKDSGTTSSVALETLPSGVSDDAHADASAETHDACHAQVHVTSFGSSSVRSCFSVEEALLLRAELDELRHTGLILSDDLHLCYFLTPLREVGKCDWELLRLMMSRMSDSRQRIASLLGVDAYFVDQQAMGLGGPLQATEEGRRRLFTARRFYVALMLADVLAEVPMATVEQRYNVSRGQLQNLMRSASMFSSSITSFCHAMEWFSLEAVLSSFVKRLGFGVKPDLLPLMEIRGMQPPRARALWNAGFKKVAAIAAADADDMVSKVKLMNPKDSKAAKFFTKRSALMAIREANLALQSQIKEKKGELQELTVCCGGGGGVRGVR